MGRPDPGGSTMLVEQSGAAPSRSSDRLLRAFGVQLGARVLGMAASIVAVAMTTRYLGPDAYGHLTSAIVFIGLWSSFTELGIGAVIVRRATSGTGDLARLVRVNSGMSLLYCLPLAAVAAASGLLLYRDQPEVQVMLLIVSGSLVLNSLTTCLEPVFLTAVRFTAVAASDAVGRFVSLAATVVLVARGADLVWFALVQLVPPAAALVIQAAAASRMTSLRPVVSLSESWNLLRESLPQTGVLVVAVLYWRADGVLLSLLSTPDQVGVYGLAYTVAFTTSMVSTLFLTSTLSTMTERYAVDRDGFARFVRRSVGAMLFVALPLAVVGAMVAGQVIGLMGSAEFVADGGPTLSVLFVAVALTFLNDVLSQALFAAHDQVFLLRLNVLNLAANLVLNVILIPTFGARGAATALLVSEVSGLVVVTWRLGRRSPYRTPWLLLVRLTVPLAVSVAVVLVVGGNVLVCGGVAAAAYVAVNLVLGPFDWSTIRALRNSGAAGAGGADPGDRDLCTGASGKAKS